MEDAESKSANDGAHSKISLTTLVDVPMAANRQSVLIATATMNLTISDGFHFQNKQKIDTLGHARLSRIDVCLNGLEQIISVSAEFDFLSLHRPPMVFEHA